tara:strand:+ start:3881 stop:4699 length:819 start_codon:yes stop_codon:yes gene_type:complete
VTKELKITQSILKNMRDYIDGKECGLLFKARYVDGLRTPSTKSQALGNWFEYKCTGALNPYDPTVPEAKISYKGTPKEKLAADYQRMEKQVENFKAAIKHYNVEIISAGETLEFGKAKGTCDIIANVDGELSIIDVKSTALFNDKWSEFGWAEIDNAFKPKLKLLTQALHYKYLAKNLYPEKGNIPFYFWVFSTKNEDDFKIIRVEVDEEDYWFHAKEIDNMHQLLKIELKKGFKAYPTIERCSKCPLKEDCSEAMDVPKVETIYYTNQMFV